VATVVVEVSVEVIALVTVDVTVRVCVVVYFASFLIFLGPADVRQRREISQARAQEPIVSALDCSSIVL